MAEEADEQVAGGDGTEQVRGGHDEQSCEDHHEREFSRWRRLAAEVFRNTCDQTAVNSGKK
jgi:hypothetical protein